MDTKELRQAEKHGAPAAAEPTREGTVYQPAVDIFETQDAIILLADVPGVRAEHLSIDLKDNVLTIRGEVRSPESNEERDVVREFDWGAYYRQFTLADSIDQSKIEARLADGVLRLQLPKLEKARPRQIPVRAG